MAATDIRSSIVRGACAHDCPDGCSWLLTVRDGKAVELAGDPLHPFTRGGLCTKVNHFLEDRVYGPARLRYPLRRSGPKGSGAFERIGWDEALEAITGRLRDVMTGEGPEAVLPISFGGTMGWLQASGMSDRFFARLGATRVLGEMCGANAGEGLEATIGTTWGMVPDELRHSRYIVLWGTNTLTTNLHLWPFIREAKERNGATVVVVDPVKTRTAAAADRHVRPMPGTDPALALGMMHVIVAEQLYDAAYVRDYTVGFERLRERLREYPPDRAARLTGLAEEEIVALARAYATTQPSAIKVQIGMEHSWSGGMAYRAVACLPALVGSWKHRGGGLAGYWFDGLADLNEAMGFPLEQPAVREVTIARVGQALTDTSMNPPVRVVIVFNCNPAVSLPNQSLVLQGLARDDQFTVVLEHTMTDTAKYADIVLPATTQLEHWDVNFGWGHTYLHLNVPAIAPVGEALPNTEVFRRLALALGMDEPMFRQTDEQMARALLDSKPPRMQGVTFDDLVERGWVDLRTAHDARPYAEGGFPTPSGKAELYSERMRQAGHDPLPGYTPGRESPGGDPDLVARYPLALMTPKTAHHFLNSSYGNIDRQITAEREPMLDLHPSDAVPRGIADGEVVRVFNDRGSLEMRCRVGDKVRPGVVAVPSGWWASRSQGGRSVNTLTPDGYVDLRGAGAFHGALVQVERVTALTAPRGLPGPPAQVP
jgi:anaerobic selenocysteine-containing dehydrogenase